MSNKALLNKLESHITGCFINQLIYIPSELFTEGHPTRAMEDFQDQDNENICEVFGWKYSAELGQRMDGYISRENPEENLCHYFYLKNKIGFLAEVHFPHHFKFRVKEDGSRGGSWVTRQICHIEWLYGETMEEIVNKMIASTDQWIQYDFEKEQANKITNHG